MIVEHGRPRLAREMPRVLTIDVLDRFHRSAPSGMPRLYDWRPGDDSITIDDQTLAFVRMSGHALETIANHWWARYLERVNMLAPLIIEKVERNGAERGSLAKYVKLLRWWYRQCADNLRCGLRQLTKTYSCGRTPASRATFSS
jgi:hypothetical protein